MHIDFVDLAAEAGFQSPRRLSVAELEKEKNYILRELIDADVDLGLVQMVHHLIDDAMESGYHGGYSDAHYYAKFEEDGA
jgi:hypothetical protein